MEVMMLVKEPVCKLHQDAASLTNLVSSLFCPRQKVGKHWSTFLNRLWMKCFLDGPALLEITTSKLWHDLGT